jgi:hypothetical protein
MIGPFVEIRRDYTICFGSRVSLAGLAVWFVALFLTVDREQHEVIEAMVTVVSVFAEVKIKLYIFWQPECDVLFGKGTGLYSTTGCSLSRRISAASASHKRDFVCTRLATPVTSSTLPGRDFSVLWRSFCSSSSRVSTAADDRTMRVMNRNSANPNWDFVSGLVVQKS